MTGPLRYAETLSSMDLASAGHSIYLLAGVGPVRMSVDLGQKFCIRFFLSTCWGFSQQRQWQSRKAHFLDFVLRVTRANACLSSGIMHSSIMSMPSSPYLRVPGCHDQESNQPCPNQQIWRNWKLAPAGAYHGISLHLLADSGMLYVHGNSIRVDGSRPLLLSRHH